MVKPVAKASIKSAILLFEKTTELIAEARNRLKTWLLKLMRNSSREDSKRPLHRSPTSGRAKMLTEAFISHSTSERLRVKVPGKKRSPTKLRKKQGRENESEQTR